MKFIFFCKSPIIIEFRQNLALQNLSQNTLEQHRRVQNVLRVRVQDFRKLVNCPPAGVRKNPRAVIARA